MISYLKDKIWRRWARAHICTLALAFSLNSTWRIPRDAFKYGGLSYGLLITAALLTVALPAVLLQLSVGQLSQQDPVGVWKAVPLLKGIGFVRLVISYIVAVCVVTYLAMSVTLFFYTLNHTIPFQECTEFLEVEGQPPAEINYNATQCFNESFFAPIQQKPEYFLALSLVVLFLWVLFPFILYKPIKSLKSIFYILGPSAPILWIIIIFSIGDKNSLAWFSKNEDWSNFLRPEIWLKAISQALIAVNVAGGFLISAGDSVYCTSDVEWTTFIYVGANILSIWFGMIVWFALGDTDTGSTVFAVLARTYNFTVEKNLSTAWAIVIFATLCLSGVISMVSLLYPLYDRFRRLGGRIKWRYIAIGSSLLGAGLAIATLVDHSVLILLEDTVLPFLVAFTTILEICAFIFIYGWKVLLHDIEFLIGRHLQRFWIWALCGVPGIIGPFLLWWCITQFLRQDAWCQPPWIATGLAVALTATIIIIIIFAIYSIARQVQYDIIGKLKSSIQPSRHWGPRDPIAHYYWLMRRDEVDPHAPRTRYHRRNLGQFSGTSSAASFSKSQEVSDNLSETKRRTNSDDWLYKYRKEYLTQIFYIHYPNRRRSKSLDWPKSHLKKEKRLIEQVSSSSLNSTLNDSVIVVEKGNGVASKC
ncbi:unnamed protein product [Leptosia nina]|uniref:Uncharacterized protein n=1 Tax=Leptosia nina TaxID=320188 RepID=A0AAV1K271_9NEOP